MSDVSRKVAYAIENEVFRENEFGELTERYDITEEDWDDFIRRGIGEEGED